MTSDQFVRWAERTFGKYTVGMHDEVEAWLSPRTPYFLAGLRVIALRDHPSVYGKPPGVHELEVFRLEAQEKGHALEAVEAMRNPRPALPEDTGTEISREDLDARIMALSKKLGVKERGEN